MLFYLFLYALSLDPTVYFRERCSFVLLHYSSLLCFLSYQPAPENSPRIGASRVVEVVIKKNDNANGIVQLSASAVRVHEPHTGSVVNVTRTAGDFGTVSENEFRIHVRCNSMVHVHDFCCSLKSYKAQLFPF